jgi:acetolactate synthase-1/2/3 large subunit
MVRQWQHNYYDKNLQSVRMFQPDFVKLAEAFGMAGLRVSEKEQVEPAIEDALRHPGPVLIDFEVEQEEDLYPAMPPGASLAETIDQPKFDETPEKVKTRR